MKMPNLFFTTRKKKGLRWFEYLQHFYSVVGGLVYNQIELMSACP
jgi:hypothetical protein